MSLARAFTTRRVKQSLHVADGDGIPHRSNTTKGFRSIRNKISSPVELVHTTNMLSYNAPDISPKSATSTTSTKSEDDLSDSAHTQASSPPTSPDIPSAPEEETSSPEPNHLSCYFTPPGHSVVATKPDAPVIPQRAPSHTKKSYDILPRQKSISRMSEQSQRTVSTKASFTFSRASSSSTSTSATSNPPTPRHMPKIPSVSTAVPPPSIPVAATPAPAQQPAQHKKELSVHHHHPFGPELAQVSELAEEYGVKAQLNMIDREEQELAKKGLMKISAEEYLTEVDSLFASFFANPRTAPAMAWI